jgi:hypothetical protein
MRSYVLVLGLGISATLVLSLDACVGDATNPAPTDAGTDAGLDSARDAAPLVDASDAASAACDLSSPFGKPVLLAGAVNSSGNDGAIWLFPDRLTAFVSSTRGDGGGAYAIYSGTRANDTSAFATMEPVVELNVIATGAGSQGMTLTADGLTVYFLNGPGGAYDVYTATRTTPTAKFQAPALVAGGVNQNGGGAGEDFPDWISPDGTTLYFTSNRSSSTLRDIYVATRAGSGPFGAPVPLASVNSDENEQTIVLSADELQAFITRRTGALYYATRSKKTDGFSLPQPIAELQSIAATVSHASADGCTIYFDSPSADGGVGGYDLYSATRGK